MDLPIDASGPLRNFFEGLMKGRIIDDSNQIADMSLVLSELVRREENDCLAGLIPREGYRSPLRVQWEYQQGCNLDCVFCYNGKDRENKETLPEDALMEIARQIVELDVLDVVLSGGEIFTDWKLLRSIGRYFRDHNVGMHLVTNGWSVSEDQIQELLTWPLLSVQVSIDGADEAAHDEFRGRKGSFRRAVHSLRMYAEAGFYTAAACALHRKNWNTLDDYLDLCFFLGARRVIIGDVLLLGKSTDVNRDELVVDSGTYEKCVQSIKNRAASYRGLMDIEFAKDPGLAIADSFLKRPTGVAIRYDGKVIPGCLLALAVGDLTRESLVDVWTRVRGGYLQNDALIQALATIETTQTPGLNLTRTFYSPEAQEVFS